MTAKQIVASYLVFQAVGTAAWWGLLLSVPSSIGWFHPEAWPADSLLGFWLADSSLLVAGSLAAAVLVLRRHAVATIAVWSVAAAAWYPTLYCIGVSIVTNEAWIASAMMSLMAGMMLAMATIHGTPHQETAAIRVTPMSKPAALRWTLAQMIIFWSVCLWVLPKGIVELEHRLGWQSFSHDLQTAGSISLFLIASGLGLASGIAMASCGKGTPLPTATAAQLVVAGPYRFVRNPMAVAGILQGIAVGWFLGSPGVIAYAVLGALFWHFFVRPVEEADLQARFAEPYRQYRSSVGLWLPTFHFRPTR